MDVEKNGACISSTDFHFGNPPKTSAELEKAMENENDPNYHKYLKIRKSNLHKMEPIPVCKFNDS